MKKLLAKIYSYIPILSITDDNNFGTNELCNKASYRFSLINLFFGHIAIYFITYNIKQKKFSFFYKIEMEECGSLRNTCNVNKIDDKAKTYINEHLNDISNDEMLIEKDFIKYLNQGQCDRIALSERKITLYTTIVLAIIPIFLAFFDIKAFLNRNWYEKFLSLFVMYCVLNVILLVFNSMKVEGITLSMFSTLKNSNMKAKQSTSNYYFDWQMHREKADIRVSYVKNIELWIKNAIVSAIILILILRIGPIIDTTQTTVKDKYFSDTVLTVNIDDLNNPYSQSSITMSELNLKIQKKQVTKIVLILPNENCIDNIYEKFKFYSDNKIIKYYKDDSLKGKNEIKIIEE